MRFGTIIILLALFSMMFIGQMIREEKGIDFDIENHTEQIQYQNISYELKSNIDQADKVQVGLYKFMDASAYAVVELGKESINYGFKHPEYDFNSFIEIIKYFVVVMLIMMIIPQLPYIIAIFYILWLGISKLYRKIRLHF